MKLISPIILFCVLNLCFLPLSAQENDLQPITDQNAHNLIQLDPVGRGRVKALRWSPDGRWLAVQTPIGIWLIDSLVTDSEPTLLRVLDEPQAFAFSPDSSLLAIAGCQGLIGLEDMLDFAQDTCEQNQTHVYDLDQDNGSATLRYVIDNGQSNIMDLTIGATPYWNAPLIIARKHPNTIRISVGRRSWELELWGDRSISHSVVSQDSQTLAVLGQDYKQSIPYVYDIRTYILRGLPRNDRPIRSIPQGVELQDMTFSADGQMLIGTAPGGLWQWDLTQPDAEPTYQEYVKIPEDYVDHQPIQVSPDFRYGFTREEDETYLWTNVEEMLTGKSASSNRIPLPDNDLAYLGFSPQGSYLLLGRNTAYDFSIQNIDDRLVPGLIRLYDTTTGQAVLDLTPAAMNHLAVLTPDETKIAYLDDQHNIHIYGIDQGKELITLTGFANKTFGVVVNPDGQLIYTSCAISIPVANTSDCVPVTLHIGEQTFPDTDFSADGISPDGQLLVSWQHGTRMLVFRDSSTGELVREITIDGASPWHLAFSPDGSQLALSGDIPLLVSLTDPNLEPIHLEIPPNEYGNIPGTPAITFSPDGQLVATTSDDGSARLWDTQTGELLALLHSDLALSSVPAGDGIAFSPDGVWVAFGACYMSDSTAASLCKDERVYVYNVSKALEQKDLQTEAAHLILSGRQEYTISLLFSPDGSLIISSSESEYWEGDEISVWSAQTGELITVQRAYGAIEIAFSPDGKILYSSSADGVVYRWGVH